MIDTDDLDRPVALSVLAADLRERGVVVSVATLVGMVKLGLLPHVRVDGRVLSTRRAYFDARPARR